MRRQLGWAVPPVYSSFWDFGRAGCRTASGLGGSGAASGLWGRRAAFVEGPGRGPCFCQPLPLPSSPARGHAIDRGSVACSQGLGFSGRCRSGSLLLGPRGGSAGGCGSGWQGPCWKEGGTSQEGHDCRPGPANGCTHLFAPSAHRAADCHERAPRGPGKAGFCWRGGLSGEPSETSSSAELPASPLVCRWQSKRPWLARPLGPVLLLPNLWRTPCLWEQVLVWTSRLLPRPRILSRQRCFSRARL